MKKPSLSTGCRCGAALALLVLALGAAGACSSSEPPPALETQQQLPGGPGVFGSPGEEPASPEPGGPRAPVPLSSPAEAEGPGATETNFLTPPCREDSDCGDGRRCTLSTREAAEADGGSEAGASDAGGAGDAGASLGRCERIDAG